MHIPGTKTIDTKTEYLSDDAWINYNDRMKNQKTSFVRVVSPGTPTGTAGIIQKIETKAELKEMIIKSFEFKPNELNFDNDDMDNDKLDIIFSILPIGLLKPYRRFDTITDTMAEHKERMDEMRYIFGNRDIPGSHPINYSYDNLDNVIGDIENRIFRHHHNKAQYYMRGKDPPNYIVECDSGILGGNEIKKSIAGTAPLTNIDISQFSYKNGPATDLPMLSFNNAYANRDITSLEYYRKDWLPTWSSGSWVYNKIRDTEGFDYGKLSKRLDSYSQVDNDFGAKFTPIAQIMNAFVSGRIQLELQNKTTETIKILKKDMDGLYKHIEPNLLAKIVNESIKLNFENIQNTISDSSYGNTIVLFQQIEIQKHQLEELIFKLKHELTYSVTTKILLEKSLENPDMWLSDSQLCIDKLFFMFLHENIKKMIRFNKKSKEAKLVTFGAGADKSTQKYKDAWNLAGYLRNLDTTFIYLDNLFTSILKYCTYGDPLFEDKSYIELVNTCIEIFKKDLPPAPTGAPPASPLGAPLASPLGAPPATPITDYSDLPKDDQKFIIQLLDLPIEIWKDGSKDKYLTIKFIDIFRRFRAIKIEHIQSITTYNSEKQCSFISQNDVTLDGELYAINTKFLFKNVSGSRRFNSNLSIIHLQKDGAAIKFQSTFNYFALLQFIYKLILLFLEKGSTKFRIYALINDFVLYDKPKNPDGNVLQGSIPNLFEKGVPVELKYMYDGNTPIAAVENWHVLNNTIQPLLLGKNNKNSKTPIKNKNALSVLSKNYGREKDSPNKFKLEKFIDDFNIADINKAPDTINKLFGFKDWKIFKQQDSNTDKGKNILDINLKKCKELIKSAIKKPLITDNNIGDKKDIRIHDPANTTSLAIDGTNISQFDAGHGLPYDEKDTFRITTGPHNGWTFKNTEELDDTDFRLDTVNSIDELEEVPFEKIFTQESPEELAEMMLIVTKMKLGSGVKLVTQGYSGTGKSFTLFGDAESKTQGVVQAVMNSLSTGVAYIRIYEIYGYALPFSFYFNKKVQNSQNPQNSDDLEPLVFLYSHEFDDKLKTWTKVNKLYKKDDIEKYMEGFKTIADTVEVSEDGGGTTSIQNYMEVKDKNFSNLNVIIEKINKQRELGYGDNVIKTIKKTVNNPSSSRSIIFVDIKIEVDGKFIPLVLVDMPGRENIYDSYKENIKILPELTRDEDVKNKILEMILWNPMFILSIPDARDKLKDIIINLDVELQKKILKETFSDIYAIVERANDKAAFDNVYNNYAQGEPKENMGNTMLMSFMTYLGITDVMDNKSIDMTSWSNDMYSRDFKDSVNTMINSNSKDIAKAIISEDHSQKQINLQNSLNILKKFQQMKHNIFTIDISDGPFQFFGNIARSSVFNILLANLFKLPKYSEKFDNLFDILDAGLKKLQSLSLIEINKIGDESNKDLIMKSYEGMFINENINGIMINLLKEHDNINDLSQLYSSIDDKDCKVDGGGALFKKHKTLVLDDSDDSIVDHFFKECINERHKLEYSNDNDKVKDNLIKNIELLKNDPSGIFSLDYCSGNIFYVGPKTPTDINEVKPIISQILSNYLVSTGDDKFMHCNDFTFLIVFTNLIGFQKCNEQAKLALDMKPFITTVSKEPIDEDDL